MHPPKATCALFFRNGRASGELLPALVGSLPGGREALAAGSPPPRGGGLGCSGRCTTAECSKPLRNLCTSHIGVDSWGPWATQLRKTIDFMNQAAQGPQESTPM